MGEQPVEDEFAGGLGFRFGSPGEVSMTLAPEHVNGIGKMLGPVGFALVDYAMTTAAAAGIGDDELAVTVNVAINFVAAADRGEVHCTARLRRRTRTIASLAAAVRDDEERLLIDAVGTFAIVPRR